MDDQGRLVGINTMMAGPEVGMAVPVHVVKEFLRQELGPEGAGLLSDYTIPATPEELQQTSIAQDL